MHCRHRPLGRLAELYSRLLHGADLSPSDEFISLILLSAAQRKTRQEHIRNALEQHKQQQRAQHSRGQDVNGGGRAAPPPAFNQASRRLANVHGEMNDSANTSHASLGHHSRLHTPSSDSDQDRQHTERHQNAVADTVSTIQTPNAADSIDMLGARVADQHQRPNGHQQDVLLQQRRHEGTDQHQDAAVRMAAHMKDMEEGLDQGHEKGRSNLGSPNKGSSNQTAHETSFHSRKSSRRHLNQDHFFHRDFMLAPSAFANEVDPDTAPDELADIYTGGPDTQSCCICKTRARLDMQNQKGGLRATLTFASHASFMRLIC